MQAFLLLRRQISELRALKPINRCILDQQLRFVRMALDELFNFLEITYEMSHFSTFKPQQIIGLIREDCNAKPPP